MTPPVERTQVRPPVDTARPAAHTRPMLALLLTAALAADPPAAGTEPIRALLVTGGSSHDYDTQKRLITEGLSSRIPIDWTVADGGRDRAKPHPVYEPGWADGYDLIVHNECFGGVVDDAFIEGIVKAHVEGTPGVFVHCSMHSYRNAKGGAEAWRELVGVKSVKHERSKRRLVAVPAHPHPTLADFPDAWHTPNGELYLIDHIGPAVDVLATAYSTPRRRDMPVIWTNTLGKARVFATTLGHHNETVGSDVWLDLVANGALWATGRLPDEPAEPAFSRER